MQLDVSYTADSDTEYSQGDAAAAVQWPRCLGSV